MYLDNDKLFNPEAENLYRPLSHRRCPVKHQTYNVAARCQWPRHCWVSGEGEWAVLAWCRVLSVSLWPSLEDTQSALAEISLPKSVCGGRCHNKHEIVHLLVPSIAAKRLVAAA